MANPEKTPTICVVTPTYRRAKLLRRFLRRMARQTYTAWRLVVVHDGADAEIEALVEGFRAVDPRIEFLATPVRGNDLGVTPRHAGVEHALATNPPDYCVLWDDDNEFRPNALQAIAQALQAHGQPDFLMVSVGWQSQILPPKGVPIDQIGPGQVDTASLVIRPQLALDAYAHLLHRKRESPDLNFYTQDYMLFEFIRSRQPKPRMVQATEVLVGFHDGLRWGPYLRRRLGIPPLNLAGRPWVTALTLGRVKAR